MSDQTIILIAIAAIIFAGLLIGFYVLKVVLPAQNRERMAQLSNRNAERMALIERNMDPSLAEEKKSKGAGSDPLLWGLLLTGIGLGAFIGYMIYYKTGMEKKIVMDALGLLFGGVGLIIYHMYKAKNKK